MSRSGRSRQRAGGRFKLVFALLLVLAAAGAWLWQRYHAFADAPLTGARPGEVLVVEPGDSLSAVLAKLRKAGVVTGGRAEWQVLARELGAAGRIQVGEYPLEQGMTPRELLVRMRDGKVISHRFTIVEGWNIRDLRAALARNTQLQHETAAMDDAALMAALGHAGQHPEGRFLPETYAFVRGDSDLDVLRRAYADMDKALDKAWADRAPDSILRTKAEALTLASIVEKESSVADERPQVAGVFTRRLKLGMRLETDPTVIYGMGNSYAGNIRRTDLRADTPYNTYLRAGLPPTPIAMPSREALRAATRPAAGDALYFVAVGPDSKRHVFSATYAEHQRALEAYKRRYREYFRKPQ